MRITRQFDISTEHARKPLLSPATRSELCLGPQPRPQHQERRILKDKTQPSPSESLQSDGGDSPCLQGDSSQTGDTDPDLGDSPVLYGQTTQVRMGPRKFWFQKLF